jgi:hypothetical protein
MAVSDLHPVVLQRIFDFIDSAIGLNKWNVEINHDYRKSQIGEQNLE